MEHHRSWLGELFNRLFGAPVGAVLNAVGIHPHDPNYPIPDHIATEIFIALLVVGFFLWFRKRLSAENPGGLQLCFEQVLSNSFRVGLYDLLDEIVGHGGRKHLAVVGTIGFFILFCNAISLIPGFISPTGDPTVPLGCAMMVFVYYHWAGIQQHGGTGYAKHFIGHAFAMPKVMWPVMVPLFILIESVSHLSRLLSLTARLYANMLASELLYVKFLALTLGLFTFAWDWNKGVGAAVMAVPLTSPLFFPLIFVGLHVFVAFIQAFVFALLPIVYLAAAVEEEHH